MKQTKLFKSKESPPITWLEKINLQKGIHYILGVDEAGRGPLAGPVVAAAAMMPPGWLHTEVDDSKKIKASTRERLYSIITTEALCFGVGQIDNREIDRINILQATLKAMRQAVNDATSLIAPKSPELLLVDGNIEIPNLALVQKAYPKGDQLSINIAAASIIAKVYRDKMMHEFHQLYPVYNFRKNKGYGTKEHLDALKKHGPCPIHRKSFKGVITGTREMIYEPKSQ